MEIQIETPIPSATRGNTTGIMDPTALPTEVTISWMAVTMPDVTDSNMADVAEGSPSAARLVMGSARLAAVGSATKAAVFAFSFNIVVCNIIHTTFLFYVWITVPPEAETENQSKPIKTSSSH